MPNSVTQLMCIFIAVTVVAQATSEETENSLQQIFADHWQFQLRENPLFATHVGEHRFNDQLPSETVGDQLRRHDQRVTFRQRLGRIDRAKLSRESTIHFDIFARMLDDNIAEGKFRNDLMPITGRAGFHISFPEMRRRVPLENVEDYKNYIARLVAFDRYTLDHIELMREGIRQGIVLPDVVLKGYEHTIESHVVDDAHKSLLYTPFLHGFPSHVPSSEQERLCELARKAIVENVVPGYRRLFKFMRDEYVPACRTSIGASGLPRGREYYHVNTYDL